nr:hypothetical protein [Tanacetum cinerariifolium]
MCEQTASTDIAATAENEEDGNLMEAEVVDVVAPSQDIDATAENQDQRNPPSIHPVFEEPELDRQGPAKLVFGNPGVGKQILAGNCYPDSDFGLE